MKARTKKRLCIVLCCVAALCVFLFLTGLVCLVLIMHRPGSYDPPAPIDDRQVSPYLTHELAANFYNNLRRGEPFELVVEQEGINDIIARGKWPRRLDGLIFSAPAVAFLPGNVRLMGTVRIKQLEVVVTIVLRPELDDSGRLHLHVARVRAGSLDITAFARSLAAEILRQQTANMRKSELPGAILSALVNDESFEPVIKIEGKKVRIERITVAHEKLTIRFVPAG